MDCGLTRLHGLQARVMRSSLPPNFIRALQNLFFGLSDSFALSCVSTLFKILWDFRAFYASSRRCGINPKSRVAAQYVRRRRSFPLGALAPTDTHGRSPFLMVT